MLEKVKNALRITTNAFDDELKGLITAGAMDLRIAGIFGADPTTGDPLIVRAIITYCKAHFGQAEDGEYDRLKASYDEQKAQLQTATGYGLNATERYSDTGEANNGDGSVWGTITQRS